MNIHIRALALEHSSNGECKAGCKLFCNLYLPSHDHVQTQPNEQSLSRSSQYLLLLYARKACSTLSMRVVPVVGHSLKNGKTHDSVYMIVYTNESIISSLTTLTTLILRTELLAKTPGASNTLRTCQCTYMHTLRAMLIA